MNNRPPEEAGLTQEDAKFKSRTLAMFDEYEFFESQMEKLLASTNGADAIARQAAIVIDDKLLGLRRQLAKSILTVENKEQGGT